MAQSTGDRATASLPRRSRFWLLPFRQTLLVGPRLRQRVPLTLAAEFAGVRPDHLMPVLVPPQVQPADAHPPPPPVSVDAQTPGQAHRTVLVGPPARRTPVPLTPGQLPWGCPTPHPFPAEPAGPLRRTELLRVQRLCKGRRVVAAAPQRPQPRDQPRVVRLLRIACHGSGAGV